jgi:hypothetical protein
MVCMCMQNIRVAKHSCTSLLTLEQVFLVVVTILVLPEDCCVETRKVFFNGRCDGFGGLVVSMLASGTRVRGFNPEAVGFFPVW